MQLLPRAPSTGTRHPQKVSVPPALLRGCPRCGRGGESSASTAGSAGLVLPAGHVPSWAGLGWGGCEQNPKCLELALGKHGSGEWLSVRGSVIGCGEPLRGGAGESRQQRSRK